MPDIFISYSQKDKARVKPLVDALEQQGWSLFWDRHIPPGRTWAQYIKDQLDQSSCVLVVWSSSSVNPDSFVQEEINYIRKRNILVPVFIDNVEPPFGFISIHAADLTRWNRSASAPEFQQVLNAVKGVLFRQTSSQSSDLSPKQSLGSSYAEHQIAVKEEVPLSKAKNLPSQINASHKPRIYGVAAFIVVVLVILAFVMVRGSGTTKTVPEAASAPTKTVPERDAATIKDIDSNTYKTIQIGKQVWMAENLDVSRYRNGDVIPQVQDPEKWAELTTGAWCYYDNDTGNGRVYGKLYNWYAVNDPRGLAPEGWHVPSDKEWQELERFLGMSWDDAEKIGWRGSIGGKLKETSMVHWRDPNNGATNETGFTALAGGYRLNGGEFDYVGSCASFWSSSANSGADAWNRFLYYDESVVYRSNYNRRVGMSVRCVRDD